MEPRPKRSGRGASDQVCFPPQAFPPRQGQPPVSPAGKPVTSQALVLFDLDARGVATITLDRPDRLNAINMAMRDQLWEYLLACRDIPDLRAIVFRGNGRAFSAGADI